MCTSKAGLLPCTSRVGLLPCTSRAGLLPLPAVSNVLYSYNVFITLCPGLVSHGFCDCRLISLSRRLAVYVQSIIVLVIRPLLYAFLNTRNRCYRC